MAPVVKRRLIDKPHCSPGIEGAVISKHLENRGCKPRVSLKPEAQIVDLQLVGPDSRDFTGMYSVILILYFSKLIFFLIF